MAESTREKLMKRWIVLVVVALAGGITLAAQTPAEKAAKLRNPAALKEQAPATYKANSLRK